MLNGMFAKIMLGVNFVGAILIFICIFDQPTWYDALYGFILCSAGLIWAEIISIHNQLKNNCNNQ